MSASLSKKSRRYGVVLVFDRKMTRQQAEAEVSALTYAGKIEPYARVEEFDERLGGPVWYLP